MFEHRSSWRVSAGSKAIVAQVTVRSTHLSSFPPEWSSCDRRELVAAVSIDASTLSRHIHFCHDCRLNRSTCVVAALGPTPLCTCVPGYVARWHRNHVPCYCQSGVYINLRLGLFVMWRSNILLYPITVGRIHMCIIYMHIGSYTYTSSSWSYNHLPHQWGVSIWIRGSWLLDTQVYKLHYCIVYHYLALKVNLVFIFLYYLLL